MQNWARKEAFTLIYYRNFKLIFVQINEILSLDFDSKERRSHFKNNEKIPANSLEKPKILAVQTSGNPEDMTTRVCLVQYNMPSILWSQNRVGVFYAWQHACLCFRSVDLGSVLFSLACFLKFLWKKIGICQWSVETGCSDVVWW